MRILSTKHLDSALTDRMRSHGVEIVCLDVLRIEQVEINPADIPSGKYDAIAFTSSNAVRYGFTHQELHDLAVSKPVFAISGKTNDALMRHGIISVGLAADSQSLADVILYHNNVRSILHVCGDMSLEVLGDKLKTYNIRYDKLIGYHTALLYPFIHGRFEAVMFYSPSGIDSFMKNNIPDQSATYCCIGETTTKYLRSSYSSLEIITANEPAPDSMINKIIEHKKAKHD